MVNSRFNAILIAADTLRADRVDPKETRNIAGEDEDTALRLLGRLERQYRIMLNGKGDPLIEQEISLPIGGRF